MGHGKLAAKSWIISSNAYWATAGLDAFSDWIAQLPHLRHLRLWDGRALVGCGELIRQNCPFFKSLEIWAWYVLKRELSQSETEIKQAR